MDYEKLRNKYQQRMTNSALEEFDNAEEFFYTMGQLLIFAFHQLGGVHKFNREFNYLTNPYLPVDIQQLGQRIIRFLSKLPADQIIPESAAFYSLQSLKKSGSKYCHGCVNLNSCSDAFYEGLHQNNLFIEQAHI